jgi:hypothetical protein
MPFDRECTMQRAIRPATTVLRNTVDDAAFALCLAAFATALAGAAGLAVFDEPESSSEVTATASQQPAPDALTGAEVNGAPVHRIPANSAFASDPVDVARIEPEARRA